MASNCSLPDAADVLRRGGLVVYPTEAVWGLGCDPFDTDALRRLLHVKQRAQAKGLILIGAMLEQFEALIDLHALSREQRERVLSTWPGPHTWTLPCRECVPEALRGDHATLAVRVTAHPIASALCRAFGGPIVSTSANPGGAPPARRRDELDATWLQQVDGIVDGETAGLERPTPIRDARTGEVWRA